MDVSFTQCAGLEGPKKTVRACRVAPDPTGQQVDGLMALQGLGPMTVALRALSDGLAAAGITPLALARAGASWQPRYHLLEGEVTVFLGNAAHGKQGPGRKTAQAEARWRAKLLRHGWLQARFSPPLEPRDWRALTRYRTKLGPERRRAVPRVQGGLARATSKLAAVATAIRGVSARAILAALGAGRADPAPLAELAQRRRRRQMPRREQALTGWVRAQQRPSLARPLAHSAFRDAPSDALEAEMTRRLAARRGDEPPARPRAPTGAVDSAAPDAAGTAMTVARALTILGTRPGGNPRGGALLVAEWGIALGRFGTAARVAAWRGVAPGTAERAGQKRLGQTGPGHQALRTGLPQLAPAAAHPQGTYRAAW